MIFLTVCVSPAFGQPDEVLSRGIVPHLTRGNVEDLKFYYSLMLNLKMDKSQSQEFQNQVVAVWDNQDYEKMGDFLVEIETGDMLAAATEEERLSRALREYAKVTQKLEAKKAHPFNAFMLAASDKERRKPAAEVCQAPQRFAAPTSNFYRLLKVGHYEGANTMTTNGLAGKAALDITNIDAAGKITAHYVAFSGLDGDGNLQGAIDEKGTLRLWGNTDPKEVICVEGAIAPDGSITAKSRFVGAVVQNGAFKIAYKSAAFANQKILQSPIPQMLYGRFEFKDGWNDRFYSPGGTSYSSNSAGDNWAIEFFDDGSYRYMQVHFSCLSGPCNTEGTIETGTFSMSGDTITFTFKGGADKYTNSATNVNLRRVMKPADAKLKGTYKWYLGPDSENNVLKFCHQKPGEEQVKGGTVCYERMK